MKNIRKIMLTCFAAISLLAAIPSTAQSTLPTGALPMIVAPHNQTLNYKERTLCFDITANVDYTATSDVAWATVTKSQNGIFVHVDQNYYGESRIANITFKSTTTDLSQVLKLTQQADASANELPQDPVIRPTNVTANNSMSGHSANLTLDKDYASIWHTAWGAGGFNVTESNPAVLTYSFSGNNQIDYINYVPRQDSQTNGSFEKVQVLIRLQGESAFILYKTFNWSGDNSVKQISFGTPLKNVAQIQFRVLSGAGGFASCAEMEFCQRTSMSAFDIFTDDLYTALKPGVTEAQIDTISVPLIRALAHQIYNGTYSTKYRVAEYPCYNSPRYYSKLWNAPGKYYDQLSGVTGINIPSGSTTAVVVRGIPSGMNVTLKVVAWYEGKDGGNFDGGNPITSTFALNNGINVINYTFGYDGLAYICYTAEGNSSDYAPIKAHFINGQVNGYLSPEKTNEEMHALTGNAKNICMDVVGKHVHSVWTSKGLHNYCKSTDGTSIGYRQYMNVLDTLITWEQRLLGFEKYNSLPNLRTMAYSNYTYYMFQGGFGVSFHHTQERRVLNCRTLVYNDEDAIWGLSHEWGHQHQMLPYFNWAGMSEVSNNMNSYYNVMHMGYPYDREGQFRNWINFANNVVLNENAYASERKVSEHRRQAFLHQDEVNWNAELQDFTRTTGADSVITACSVDATRGWALQDLGVNHALAPLVDLYNYFSENGFPDIAPDWYESLRQSDNAEGSKVEKQNGLDKYELLASAQNGSNVKWNAYKTAYPTSVWTTHNFVAPSRGWYSNSVPFIFNYIRKVSRLTGYNLTPFFEKWGFLRQVSMRVGDYGDKWYILTPSMYDEFVQDMDALGLQECNAEMIRTISTYKGKRFARPTFPN